MKDRLIELIINAPKLDCIKGGRANGKTYQTGQNIADYLIANGVVCPPCKVGDMVYYFAGSQICEGTVKSFITNTNENYYAIVCETKYNLTGFIKFGYWMFGKTVFLTKEDTEKALRG